MRIGCILAALITLAPIEAAAERSIYVTLPGPTFAAKSVASSIFQKAGISVVWGPKKQSQTPLRVEIEERTPDGYLPGALAESRPYGSCSKSIVVFSDRIRALARTPNDQAVLLGYVLVHEIAHVILRNDHHSDAGVMKANWDALDRAAIFDKRLNFLEEDAIRIRQELAAGWCKPPATLIVRSGSGNAGRQD